jgi:hypothetical protein
MKKKGESSNNIWVLILEKAWAKVFGNYAAIEQVVPFKTSHTVIFKTKMNFGIIYNLVTKRNLSCALWFRATIKILAPLKLLQ